MFRIAAAALCLVSTTAFAAPKIMRPVSVQEGRWHALQAAKVDNVWKSGHQVNLVGFSKGRTIVMVKSADLKTPAFVAMTYKNKTHGAIKAVKLGSTELSKLGVVTPAKALRMALKNGGTYKNVSGTVQSAGASNKGFAYKFTITPSKPMPVKGPYGSQLTVNELTRMVNALGAGETAYAK